LDHGARGIEPCIAEGIVTDNGVYNIALVLNYSLNPNIAAIRCGGSVRQSVILYDGISDVGCWRRVDRKSVV
jgi:hypothetical protein